MTDDSKPTAKPTSAAPADELQQAECVYLGLRQHTKNEMVQAWIPLAAIATLGGSDLDQLISAQQSLFEPTKKKPPTPLVVGGVYRVQCKLENGRLVSLAARAAEWLRFYSDNEARSVWDSTDRAARAHKRTMQMLEKVRATPAIEAQLDALRAHYHRTHFADRTALELMILSYIRKRG